MASDSFFQPFFVGPGPSAATPSLDDKLRALVMMGYAASRRDPMCNWPQQHLYQQVLDYNHRLPPLNSAEVIEQVWSTMLERERSDVASLARFAHRVDDATFFLCAAFEKAEVRDFEISRPRNVVQSSGGMGTWYAALVNATFDRYRDLRKALVHPWTPPAEVEPLVLRAFLVLCDLTPAGSQLRSLFITNRPRAFHELAQHLDIVTDQLKAAIQLAANLEPVQAGDELSGDKLQLNAVQTDILQKAGEPLSLTSAAARLGISRQALHKRIQAGSALGLMRGSELVVPSAQFVERDGTSKIVDGLSKIVALFDAAGAGRWSAIQFMTEIDPLLKAAPLDVLKRGDTDAAVVAARGYLGVDEA
jgi:hypothetical protein